MKHIAEPIDIGQPTADICRALGLEPRNVALLAIQPRTLEAHVFLTDESGSKYIAAETKTFKVRT